MLRALAFALALVVAGPAVADTFVQTQAGNVVRLQDIVHFKTSLNVNDKTCILRANLRTIQRPVITLFVFPNVSSPGVCLDRGLEAAEKIANAEPGVLTAAELFNLTVVGPTR